MCLRYIRQFLNTFPIATAKKAAGAKKFSKCQKKTMKSMFNMTQIKCFPSG